MLVAQITDLHIKAAEQLAYRKVDTAALLERAVEHLNELPVRPDVVLVTGDLVDTGAAAEYARLRAILAMLDIPYLLIPGNHDRRDELRAAFPDHPWLLGSDDFIHYSIDDFPLRLIGLDSTDPGKESGRLCGTRIEWLDATLARTDQPALLFMHHPPFATGMAHHDRTRLENRQALAEVIARHGQVRGIVCGHLHRTVAASWAGIPVSTVSSTAHQAVLDLRDDADLQFSFEPPAFQLLMWDPEEGLISHICPIGDFDGPHPFFENGKLID